MIDRAILIRGLSFAVYFIIVFLVFLLLLFPFDRIKTKLESEVRSRTPLELTVGRISPRFFNRFVLADVMIRDKTGKLLFESPSVNTTVSLISLLRGRMSVSLKAGAYGGKLLVKLQQAPGRQYVLFDADGLDVASHTLVKDSGYKVSGKLGGNFEMTGDSGKGRFWLKGLTTREIKVKGFPVPDLDFDKGWMDVDVKGDRMMIRKLELDGKELKVQITGDVVLRERGTINLTIRLKPSERLAHEQASLLSMLVKRDVEGYYQFSLGGLLSEPMPRF